MASKCEWRHNEISMSSQHGSARAATDDDRQRPGGRWHEHEPACWAGLRDPTDRRDRASETHAEPSQEIPCAKDDIAAAMSFIASASRTLLIERAAELEKRRAKLGDQTLLRNLRVQRIKLDCESADEILSNAREIDVVENFELGRNRKIVQRIEEHLLKGVERNIRARVLAELSTNLNLTFSRNYSRTLRVGELYEREPYSRVEDFAGKDRVEKQVTGPGWLPDIAARRRSHLLRGLMFVHLKQDLVGKALAWRDCPPEQKRDDVIEPALKRRGDHKAKLDKLLGVAASTAFKIWQLLVWLKVLAGVLAVAALSALLTLIATRWDDALVPEISVGRSAMWAFLFVVAALLTLLGLFANIASASDTTSRTICTVETDALATQGSAAALNAFWKNLDSANVPYTLHWGQKLRQDAAWVRKALTVSGCQRSGRSS
jgi:hypothetical protein